MAKEFTNGFYVSQPWIKCRKSYAKSVGGLCENCMQKGLIVPGRIVHHIIPITPQNISDPTVTLNWDNLKLLCMECHKEIHNRIDFGYRFDSEGNIIETRHA